MKGMIAASLIRNTPRHSHTSFAIMVNVYLIFVAVAILFIIVVGALYLVVYFQHEEDKNTAWFPKIVVVGTTTGTNSQKDCRNNTHLREHFDVAFRCRKLTHRRRSSNEDHLVGLVCVDWSLGHRGHSICYILLRSGESR